MRELRVIGLTPDSAHIVCADTESGQKFQLPADDKLRAAARGDLARFGQIEIETEATMRPRDIQTRIRAGASVAQVAELARMPISRVERFAYPVLLERARAAELAQKAHPMRSDGPAVETLFDVVTAAFTARGHTLDSAEWDAWKDEQGAWVAQLQWQNGRSEIAAHWRYVPDSHGGSVSPLDDPATDLIDPDFGRALRGLATLASAEEHSSHTEGAEEIPATGQPIPEEEPAVAEYFEQPAVAAGGTARLPTVGAGSGSRAPTAGLAATEITDPATPDKNEATTASPEDSPATQETAVKATEPDTENSDPAAGPGAKPARPKRGKAPMPSWEDVLLGVRSGN